MKTDVYSWRLSSQLKSDLERAARRRNTKVSSVLEAAAREWLTRNAADVNDDAEQKRLHAAVAPLIGSIKGSDPRRSEKVNEIVRKSLRREYGR